MANDSITTASGNSAVSIDDSGIEEREATQGARVLSEGKRLGTKQVANLLFVLKQALPDYPYDQYRHYPSKDRNAWQAFFSSRLDRALCDKEWTFFFGTESGSAHLIGCKQSAWDEDHFGIKMASVQVFLGRNPVAIGRLIDECIEYMKGKRIAFVSTRINGDNTNAIHEFQHRGFQYYENIIWPVLKCKAIEKGRNVRLMEVSDLDRVAQIARTSTYQRSHFHCDDKFSRDSINEMHVKWIKASWEKKEPIAVIESDRKVAGYFVFKMDDMLASATGYRYGRMSNLAIDHDLRGAGLGKTLFAGAIGIMREMGAQYIDSGYASKNHKSARLHMDYGFESVYEEVTMHLWQ